MCSLAVKEQFDSFVLKWSMVALANQVHEEILTTQTGGMSDVMIQDHHMGMKTGHLCSYVTGIRELRIYLMSIECTSIHA